MKLEAQGDHVIIRPEGPSTTESGIIIADTSGGRDCTRGIVISVGNGKPGEDPPDVAVGSTVVFPQRVGHFIQHEGEKLLVLRGDDLFARVVQS